jgi:hypothetical protein
MSAVVKTLEALFAAERDLRGAHKTSKQKNNNNAQQRGRAATRLGAVQTARPYDEGIDGGDHHLETSDHESEGDGLEHEDGEAKKEGSQVVREGMKKSRDGSSPPKKSYTWAASRQDVREHYLGGQEDNNEADHGNNHDIEEGLRGNLTAKKSKGKDKLAASSTHYTQFDS